MRVAGQVDSHVITATLSKEINFVINRFLLSVSLTPRSSTDPSTISLLSTLLSQYWMEDIIRAGLEESFRSPYQLEDSIWLILIQAISSARDTLALKPNGPSSTTGTTWIS